MKRGKERMESLELRITTLQLVWAWGPLNLGLIGPDPVSESRPNAWYVTI